MKRINEIIILTSILVTLSRAGQAHDYWVMPATFEPAGGSIMEAHFTYGHDYFVNESLPDVSRFRVFAILPDGREIGLPYHRIEATQATVLAPLVGDGTYILGAVSTQPEFWSSTEKGYRPGGRSEVPDALSTSSYVKSTKTFLNLGQPSEHYGAILGHPIEIVPLANPALMKRGDTLAIKVLLHGQPAMDAEVIGVYDGFEGGHDREAAVTTKTDAQGIARISVDRAGRWMLRAKVERDAPPESGLNKENFRSYLLMRVAERAEGDKQ